MPTVNALNLGDSCPQAAEVPLCAVVGEDESLRTLSVRVLLREAAPLDQPGSMVRRLEEVPPAREVFDELRTVPFLGLQGRRAVVVDRGDEFLRTSWRQLLQYLQAPSRTSTLVVCLSALSPGKPPGRAEGDSEAEKVRKQDWRRLVKAIRERCLIVDCAPPSWPDAKRWVRVAADGMGNKVTPGAVEALVSAVGPNLLALEAELAKLSSYVGPGGTIAEHDVGELVAQARARSAFNLADAVARGDAAEALRLCERLTLGGESREGILSVLAFQTGRLWRIKRLHDDGAAEKDVARQLGVPGFVVRRALQTLPALSEERMARQLHALAAADVESKTSSLRVQEGAVWLESLLMRLCGL